MIRGILSRRTFVGRAAIAASAAAVRPLWAQSAATAKTRDGVLRGSIESGVSIFRGVPFAQPPVGDLRFRAPVKPLPWKGERDALKFAAAAMQPDRHDLAQSEDCLYLNVWAPDDKGPHPVFVWIHGGGFTGGESFDPVSDGTEFARQGIVCITVAYRLGVFGFLDVAPLLGAEYAGSANNGLRDLMAALTWVQENVTEFGGDPKQVTVGGESAGAKLTDILMGIPAAKGLFQQAVSESGGAERVWPAENATAVSHGFDKAWRDAEGGQAASLKSADAGRMIAVQEDFMKSWPQHFPLRPEIDGGLIPRLPVETIAAGSTRGKRLLIGTNREESALFIGPHPKHDATAADVGNLSLAKFDAVYQKYKALYPEMNDEQRRIRALTAEEYWVPSLRVADALVRGGGEAFVYELTFAESSGRMSGYAYHSLDVFLVWDKPHRVVLNAVDEAALAGTMHAAWLAFIQGKIPAATGLPAWPAYKTATRPTMMLDSASRVEERPQEAELRLWDHVL